MRRAAVRLAAFATGSATALAVDQLTSVYGSDPVPEVRADTLTALALLDLDKEAAGQREQTAFASGMPALRLSAALLAMERCGPPYPAEAVQVLARDGADPDPGEDDIPFPALGTTEGRINELLGTDVAAALTVAGHWITEGDLGSRGSWHADKIAGWWRDREDDVIPLLAEALPHQRDTLQRALRLEAIARWIGRAHRPDPGLLDTLLAHTVTPDERSAAAAQLALADRADTRFLDTTDTPNPAALTLLATRTGQRDHQRRALHNPDPDYLAELLASLSRDATIELLPELGNLLRNRTAPILIARHLGTHRISHKAPTELLADAMTSTDSDLSLVAAVSSALLGNKSAPAVSLLKHHLLCDPWRVPWHLREAGRLAQHGAPLLPVIADLCSSSREWTKGAAAEAHWRITAEPTHTVPILTSLAAPTPVGLNALLALAAIGTTPEELRPRLRHWAWSPRRLLITHWPPRTPHPDEELRTTAQRLLDQPAPGPSHLTWTAG